MGYRFPLDEVLKEELKRYYLQELPAKLAAISAEKADNIDLRMFEERNVYIVDKTVLPRYPSMEILVSRSRPVRLISGGQVTDFHHDVHIIVGVAGADEEVLGRQLSRYLRAVAELCEDNPHLGGFAYDVMFEEINYTPTVNAGGSTLQKSGWVTATMKTREGT